MKEIILQINYLPFNLSLSNAVSIIILLPLFSFLLLGIFFKKNNAQNKAGILASCLLFISSILAILIAYNYFFIIGKQNGIYQAIVPIKINWLSFTPSLSIDMGIMIDSISILMLVIITFISLMVHIYSLGYMKNEKRLGTYFSFLSLFTFSMLGLVISSNIFQMYIFWELVGVSSFLLIGFYYDNAKAVAAAKKAFIVTRFADVGFLIGIIILSYYANTFDFKTLIIRLTTENSAELKNIVGVTFLGITALTWGLLLIFIGGAGKSAMFPLHIWLPDAMMGPTPVSALIHAATMVVAGVFLVARLFPIYSISCPAALQVVAIVGIFSSLFAALIACTQTDIKRILAFSTMSQIGFMMFSLGVSGYSGENGLGYAASMFHLFTHAFFKALLFLGAGSVIHYVHSNELINMGGLRKNLPVTHFTFLIGCLAISGFPFLAGFFSKEEILLAVYQKNIVIFYLALITSGLTAFYMFRLYFSIFWQSPQKIPNQQNEGSLSMKVPLIILAVCALFAGYIPFGKFVSSDGHWVEMPFHFTFSLAPTLISFTGILIAYIFYKKKTNLPDKMALFLNKLYIWAHHKFYIDELYLFVTHKIIFKHIAKPIAFIDKKIIDGLVNETGNSTQKFSEDIKEIQSGKLQQYAMYFLCGILLLVLMFYFKLK